MESILSKESLKKELGLLGSFSMGFADVGADIFLALGLIAAYAHGLMPFAILIASIVYICSGLAYAELASAIPVCGGASSFGKRAFGRFSAFIAGWGLILDYTLDIALFAVASAGYLSFFLPQTLGVLPLVAATIIFVLMLVNLLGIRESSIINSALTVAVIAIVVGLIALGFTTTYDAKNFMAGIHPVAEDPGWDNFLYSITLAMVAFVGIESISQGAEETKNPGKTIPRATMLAVFFVVSFAIVLSVMALGIVSPAVLEQNMNNPLLPLAQALPFANVIVPIIAFAGFTICFVSANTGIIGVSRVAYSMSVNELISRRIRWIHPVFRTPWVTTISFSLIAMALAYSADMVFLGELYAFGALTAYSITNMSLIKLRITEPNLERPFKVPGNINIRGRDIPIVSVIGVISCLAVFGLVALLHVEGRNFAIVWFAVGILYFVFYKNYRKGIDGKKPAANQKVDDSLCFDHLKGKKKRLLVLA